MGLKSYGWNTIRYVNFPGTFAVKIYYRGYPLQNQNRC